MRTSLLVPFVGCLLATMGFNGVAKKKDQELIQGTWTSTKLEFQGKESDSKDAMKWVFKDAKLMNVKDGKTMVEGTFKLDPDKNPKEIDIVITFDAFERKTGKEAAKEDKNVRGVYTIEGDTLKIALGPRGGKRNTKFSGEGENRLMYFKRAE
jgi:uncharacterized protein (TIGR03067 family)